jgi:hypothetical protein
MKRLGTELLAQFIMVILVATLAGFVALIVAVPIGGTAFGLAPEPHINLVAGLMCPSGSKVVFEEGGEVVTYSGDGPSYGTAISVQCEDANGVRTLVSPEEGFGPFLGGIGLVLAGYFLACFAPLFLLGLLLGGLLTHKLVAGSANRRPAPPAVTSF